MQYKQLAEVSNFVSDKNHDLSDVLQLLCVKVLAALNAGGVIFTQVNRLGYVTPQSSFGLEINDSTGSIASFHLSERTPFTDAIRENRVIVINTLPTWPKQYSQMEHFTFSNSFKSLVVCPVNIDGLPVGCLSTFTHSKIQLDNELADFLEAITMIIAGWFRRSSLQETHLNNHLGSNKSLEQIALQSDTPAKAEDQGDLTERQMLILKMISEGRTNAAIADVLGYSESLIRQETIRIYAKLQCSGRSEAAQIYHSLKNVKEAQAV